MPLVTLRSNEAPVADQWVMDLDAVAPTLLVDHRAVLADLGRPSPMPSERRA